MSRILVLAKSGFGKTFSMGKVKELGHIGLNPKETFLISVSGKNLSFPGWANDYITTTPDKLNEGNRIITNDASVIANTMVTLAHPKSPFKNILLDDTNYVMQDYYMKNALKGGWDTPKKIGANMDAIFAAMELLEAAGKNTIMLAHPEVVTLPDGRIQHKMKTTGKMVDEYITPEGKFDITLIGVSRFDPMEKRVIKEFVCKETEQYESPKSPYGMFENDTTPNDLGYILQKNDEYIKRINE